MRLFDTSFYNIEDSITEYVVEVLPVNGTQWISFPVGKYFSLVLNSANLLYTTIGAAGLVDLPDGIYEFKQSYNPKSLTTNHFYHLRTTELTNKIKTEVDKLLCKVCQLSREEYKQNRNKLREIQDYAEAAVFKVEEMLEKKLGIELYEWAVKLLEQYSNECKC